MKIVAEKKMYREPILMKYDDKLDKVTIFNNLDSNAEAKPSRKKEWSRLKRN